MAASPRSNGQVTTPDAPVVPEVYTFTLPESYDNLGTNVTLLDVDGLPAGVHVIAIHAEDMYLSSTSRTVLRANVRFTNLDRTDTLSLNMTRKATAGDKSNPELVNPKNAE